MKIAVGMSGGVDSSVAALLLKQAGHEVTGITMAIWDGSYGDSVDKTRHACYGPDEKEDIEDAQKVCDKLGIKLHVFDCAKEYKATVLRYFRNEYAAGRTPNPCVKCNHAMKFGLLPGLARKSGLDFDFFATGHYANVEHSHSRSFLLKASDTKKDQTYFLYRLRQEQLRTILFPLGNLSKEEVRRIAVENGIPVSAKEESQDFYCGDYKELLHESGEGGDIIDTKGNILGRHEGVWNFTPGQRKGIGIAAKEALYVLKINAGERTVTVGTAAEAFQTKFMVNDLNWIAFEEPETEFGATVKIRSAQTEKNCIVRIKAENQAEVEFEKPGTGTAPGQSAVFYRGQKVLGGGIINEIIF